MPTATLTDHISRPLFTEREWVMQARRRIDLAMRTAGLTARQRQVAWMVFDNLQSGEIAERLYVSQSTVKNTLTEIGQRLAPGHPQGTLRISIAMELLGLQELAGIALDEQNEWRGNFPPEWS